MWYPQKGFSERKKYINGIGANMRMGDLFEKVNNLTHYWLNKHFTLFYVSHIYSMLWYICCSIWHEKKLVYCTL